MDTRKVLANKPSAEFWYTNAVGWGAVALINTGLQYFRSTQDLERASYGIIPIIWCFFLTSGLRLYWGYRNVYALEYKKLILRLIPHSLIVTLLVVVFGIGNILLIRNYGQSLTSLVVNNFIGLYPIVLLWIAIYFGTVHSMNLRRKERDNLRLLNSLQQAQLANLRNQLNPHFLFNALNNIKSLIREDGERARAMISSLTDILRYSLSTSKEQTVTVERELAFVKEYLELEQLHVEERLRYEVSVDERVGDCLIPPMVIQILVENAVKHGISRLPSGGTVSVKAGPERGSLVIRVSNSGPGASSVHEQGNGVGLTNIKERLSLLYGEKAGIVLRENNESVTVTVTLPLEKSNESDHC